MRAENNANRVHVDNPDEIVSLHPDNSLEVLSEGDHSLNQPKETQQGGFSACYVSVISGTLSSDNEEYTSDSNLTPQPSMKRSSKAQIPSRLRQSQYGRV